jgi:cystathionine beta-lyase family protein involved in aluminum resistance
VEPLLRPVFERIDATVWANTERVLEAFRATRVRELHFQGTTGYGFHDAGREALEELYARVFGAEAALVRAQVVSGTHAIVLCLQAVLQPGQELVAAAGRPYDTLYRVIGAGEGAVDGLVQRGVGYREVPLGADGRLDLAALRAGLGPATGVVFLQRSRGYSERQPLSLEEIRAAVTLVRECCPQAVCLVDNCYGEFTSEVEPPQVGADLTAGSLIKNPGGGLAPCGGYVVGRRDLVEAVACRLTAPGLGREVGASLWDRRLVFQGLFMAPLVVGEALKGAVLVARVLADKGYAVSPAWDQPRSDIVQAVRLGSAEAVRRFCQAVQSCSPVDSDLVLEYSPMAGYTDPVVMAAGTFVQGSSIELSCDAPLRPPFVAYWQGGLSYGHVRLALAAALAALEGRPAHG